MKGAIDTRKGRKLHVQEGEGFGRIWRDIARIHSASQIGKGKLVVKGAEKGGTQVKQLPYA